MSYEVLFVKPEIENISSLSKLRLCMIDEFNANKINLEYREFRKSVCILKLQ